MRLRGVLDDGDPQVRERARSTVEVDGDHGAGAIGQGVAGRVFVERGGLGFHVDGDGDRTGGADRGGRRHRGERGDDDLVAGPDTQRGQAQPQRLGSRRHGDRVAAPTERRELVLERRGLLAEQEPARAEDALDGVRQVRLERVGTPREVHEGDDPGCDPRAQRYHASFRR